MKIRCDACEKNLAAVMCCADEAALCTECDARIHSANKLAYKHVRVALHAAPEPPQCDICQEKRGFFFCLEDRALLCRDCDVSIHTANTLSCNHKRFVVPGTRVALEELKDDHPLKVEPPISLPEVVAAVALSSLPITASSTITTQSSPSSHYSPNNNQMASATLKPAVYRDPAVSTPPFAPCCPPYSSGNLQQNVPDTKLKSEFLTPLAPQLVSVPSTGNNVTPTMKKSSTISEFLTAAVPGWRVDELLNFPDATNSCSNPANFNAAAGGDYDWTAELSFFEEHMFAMHEVPQFPPSAPVAALPRSLRGAPRNSKNSGKLQDMFLNPRNSRNSSKLQDVFLKPHGSSCYDDAFIVPDIRMPSGPLSPPAPKRFKRDLYLI